MITNVSDRELALQQALDDTRREVLAYSITVENTECDRYEARAWSVTDENLELTVARLKGEAAVMLRLLTDAVGVLQTVEPECSTEDETLTRLRGDIWSVLVDASQRDWSGVLL